MYNRVILIGKIGRDVAIRPVGQSRCANLQVCTWINKLNKQKNEWEKVFTWHNVVVWGEATKSCEKLEKGDTVYVEGEIQNRDYTSKDGTPIHRTEVVGIVKRIAPKYKPYAPIDYNNMPQRELPKWTTDEEDKAKAEAAGIANDDDMDMPF